MIDYYCPDCGYVKDEMVSGPDRGFVSRAHGFSCADCRELFVAWLGDGEETGFDNEGSPDIRASGTLAHVSCPKDQGHRVSPWQHPGPCPRCGATLREGQNLIMWD